MSNTLCYMTNIQVFIILFLTSQPLNFGLLFLRDISFVHNFDYCFILLANLFTQQLPIDHEIIDGVFFVKPKSALYITRYHKSHIGLWGFASFMFSLCISRIIL